MTVVEWLNYCNNREESHVRNNNIGKLVGKEEMWRRERKSLNLRNRIIKNKELKTNRGENSAGGMGWVEGEITEPVELHHEKNVGINGSLHSDDWKLENGHTVKNHKEHERTAYVLMWQHISHYRFKCEIWPCFFKNCL